MKRVTEDQPRRCSFRLEREEREKVRGTGLEGNSLGLLVWQDKQVGILLLMKYSVELLLTS